MISVSASFGQRVEHNSDTIHSFNIVGRGGNIELLKEDSVLYTDHTNRLYIKANPERSFSLVRVNGGKLTKRGRYLTIEVEPRDEVLVSVFECFDSKLHLVHNERIEVVELPPPSIRINGVGADSIINRRDLLTSGTLVGILKRFGETRAVIVKEFTLSVFTNGEQKKISAKGSRLTPAMRELIKQLGPGESINLVNVKCLLPNGRIKLVESTRIFIDYRPSLLSLRVR